MKFYHEKGKRFSQSIPTIHILKGAIMTFRYSRSYTGPVKLVVFDWAGTTVDFGCQAPISAFVEGYRAMGIEVPMDIARRPMGMEKRDHIRAVAVVAEVADAWQKVHGRAIDEDDIDRMYNNFVDLLLKQLAEKSRLLPGVAEAIRALKSQGIKIGTSTGYFTEAAEIVAQCAAREGYVPDFTTCSSDVPAGRPAPWMIYRVMEHLGIYPPESVVTVGDTPVDIEAGLNSGVWCIGVAGTGNQLGLTEQEAKDLAPEVLENRMESARTSLAQAGAHWVIDTMDKLPGIIEEINTCLEVGEKP